MLTYPFMQVDAFTDQPLGGNPCAILFDTDKMSDKTMLAIAKETNQAETSFVRQSDKADIATRYFTPAEEVPLAGHPTIATIFALLDSGRISLKEDLTKISLELKAGVIEIEVFASGGKVEQIVMAQMKPEFLAVLDPEEVMPAFGLSSNNILPSVPIQIVSTGTPMLMIPVRKHEVLKQAEMDIPAYRALKDKYNFFSPHLFSLGGVTPSGDTFARHFGIPPDLMEDPFTGSATGGMGAYLWHHGLIDKPTFTAEQGHWMGRPGTAQVEVVGPREDIETVKVGGQAVTVIKGEITV